MPKIREDIITAVNDTAKIEDVVGDFVELRKSGVNLTGLCPFHQDKHDGNFIVRPSTVSEKRGGNTYRCFVCNKKGGPVQFLMDAEHMTFPDAIRYLGKKYCIEVDDVPINWTPPPPRPTPPPLPVLEIPRTWVSKTMDMKSIFTEWIWSIRWDSAQKSRIREVFWLYCVGGWRDGRTVFWLIDNKGLPRSAKLMQYKADGHRDKERNPGWIYNQEGCRQICKPDDHEILKPLFGMHLLNRYPKATVHIVESEKTAILMAIAYGNHARQVWMACGGIENLNREKLKPIIDQKRDIILYPDRDGIQKWKAKAENLHYDKVVVDEKPVTSWWQPCDGEKADIADVVIRIIQSKRIYKNVEELVEDMPALQALHDKLNLEIVKDE